MEKQLTSEFNAEAVANDDHTDMINEQELFKPIEEVISPSQQADQHFDQFISSINAQGQPSLEQLAQRLAVAFNHSPFNRHAGLTFSFENGEWIGRVQASTELIGNVAFGILHGGVAATLLDAIGGLVGIYEIYRRGQGTFEEQVKKAGRLATVDLRIDYLAPGRGKEFTATAEIIRMGRKGHTARMLMINEEGKPIAHGIASYAF